ncbi:GNAT family N-acetyltransferase [Cohnella lubricantis]|uniref:GNAT family N-acetyltransferase n=1 Tax=Cohnella lubricantis TaxID=2163172 RepID=A0A841TFF9_9BACL|nr:GNAT family N-acetyltransferase [Cohnella lubricantis]MBB6678699.1 GNAT family N-acetyltransferase [Cohnella lubricantis]MBP2118551.1 ribosomal protein S18 acetylase RimI-like enzyme [Cohnella lubricantis]
MIIKWDDVHTAETIALWNREAVRDGYKEMTEDSFRRIFRHEPHFDPDNTFLLLKGGKVHGFACGCTGGDLPLGDAAGYITCIVLAEECRSDENYGLLLRALEDRFRHLGKKQADVLFFNPMQLPWYIPDTPRHEHNNAPGVPVGSALHAFLLRSGYIQRATQQAMYLNLADFIYPDDIRAREAKAAEQGYEVSLFDPSRHRGLTEMLAGLGNPLWEEEISACAADGRPFVLASKDGAAAGFAGPVIRQPNGRGYFAGIGVHPDHEGHGLGTVLFFRLCKAFLEIGTDYMSLYTGSTNPALRIYERAGFRPVTTFATMRKEFNS